jgi:hypothetical protein
MFASNLRPSTAFTVIAEYGIGEYYFILVVTSTTVRELVWLWNLVNVGHTYDGMDAPAGFKYGGQVMDLDATVEDYGMSQGSTFQIPLAFEGVVMGDLD